MKQILTTIILMMSLTVFSQEKTVTGEVLDETGVPLIGVSLIVKGTKTGTVTDFDGQYIMKANAGDVFVFSYVGMKTQEVTIGQSSTIDITMLVDAASLDEVVVIGYGTQKRSDVTGAVSTVDVKDTFEAPAANLGNALQGRATGVQVTSSSGSPGSSASIIIRGGNSITAGNTPLYVIDGFVGTGGISNLNPNDIESMQILKDASSTAIYGARGTNGVILITTKKGTQGKMSVNFKTSSGMQSLPSEVDVQSGYQFASWINSQDQNPADGVPFDLDNLPGEQTNWQEALIRSAPMSDYQLSVSGGNETTQHYSSVGYMSQDGIVKGTGFERLTFRTNIDTRISKIFKTGSRILLSRTNTDNNNVGFQGLLREDPLKPVYLPNGDYNAVSYGTSNGNGYNFLANNEMNLNETIRDKILLNTYIQAELGHFTLKSTFGADVTYTKINQFTPSTNPTQIWDKQLAEGRVDQDNSLTWLNENTVNYNNTFGHSTLDVLGGITWQQSSGETSLMSATQIPNDGTSIYGIGLAPKEFTNMNQTYSEWALFSLLARANYTYKEKYLATASIRRDGSSRLGANNRYAVFPSFALGWKISEESFLKNSESLDLLKLRGSYGKTGNQNVGVFSTLPSVASTGGPLIMGGVPVSGTIQQATLANPNLKWETTSQFDIGLEASFFQGRLSAELDFYYKKTEDLLLNAEVPNFTGYETTLQNVGSLENKGIDLNLSGVIVQNDDFQFTTSINLSTNKNEVLDLGTKSYIVTNNLGAPANDPNSQLMVGQPVGIFWGYVYEGIDAATGDAILKDISGPEGIPDGVVDGEYDKTIIGDANPDFYGGLQLDFKYKRFDLNAFFPFAYGNENYNTQIYLVGETQINSFASLRDQMWSVENPDNATVPRVGSTSFNNSNSFYVQNASYFRLGTLQFGYTLPEQALKGIGNFRIFFTGNNLFLVKDKDYLGYDPDVNTGNDVSKGFDSMAYPQNRTLLIGVDITL